VIASVESETPRASSGSSGRGATRALAAAAGVRVVRRRRMAAAMACRVVGTGARSGAEQKVRRRATRAGAVFGGVAGGGCVGAAARTRGARFSSARARRGAARRTGGRRVPRRREPGLRLLRTLVSSLVSRDSLPLNKAGTAHRWLAGKSDLGAVPLLEHTAAFGWPVVVDVQTPVRRWSGRDPGRVSPTTPEQGRRFYSFATAAGVSRLARLIQDSRPLRPSQFIMLGLDLIGSACQPSHSRLRVGVECNQAGPDGFRQKHGPF
jgi:hypothetical protein